MVKPAENPQSTDRPLPHHAQHARPAGPAAGPAVADSVADPSAGPVDNAVVQAEREVTARLVAEFQGTHPDELVSRCVIAARHGAEDVIGSHPGATAPIEPDLIERIARQHLRVLAMVDAEMGGGMTLRHTP